MIAAVTGARGLIGRYIVRELVDAGWHVRILSRQLASVAEIAEHPNVQVITADINNRAAIQELIDNVEMLFHCAGELNDEAKMYSVNVLGTKCILQALETSKTIKYFCHLSSAGVVGPTTARVVDENTKCYPSNVYEQTKYEAEMLVHQAGLSMNVCILRPANVFDVQKLGVLNLAVSTSKLKNLTIFLKGNEGAHLVHAEDVAAAALFFVGKTLARPEIIFLSYDDDERNTVIGVLQLFNAFSRSYTLPIYFCLPSTIMYWVRTFFKGRSLHGSVRFSGKKLRGMGFDFPLGLEKAVKSVYREYSSKEV